MKGNQKHIPIRCNGNRYLPLGRLKAFQGDLKEMKEANA
jgi:hypothetical protein